jgi:hypothetical protein
MPSPVKFLGLSVKTFSSQESWGTSPATLTVNMVPDLIAGDEFIYENNPDNGIWTVHSFTAGSFRFRGFITNWVKDRSETANPTYTVTLSDCRDVLNGTKVVIGTYYARTDVAYNAINAFGYWENVLGFGNSLSNDGGMPWQLILRAVKAIVNDGAAPLYGGRLRWKNEYFTLDLSQIPVPPLFYKIQGNPAVSLLQCIDQVCNDAGRDWYIDVTDNNVITVKTISRKQQLQYNKKSINQYANSIQQAKNISSGWEAINDRITSKLLFGSNVSYLYHSTQAGLLPYWGTDIDGNYIYSSDLEDSTVVNLNCSICSDILGTTSYSTTIGEIRIAMYSEQAWLTYMSIRKTQLAAQLGIPIFYRKEHTDALRGNNFPTAGPPILSHELGRDAARFLNSTIGADNAQYEKIKRVHQMIAQAGQNFMGRSYLVQLPFVMTGYDPETTEVFYSYTIDNEGGYVALGETTLGLNDANRLLFESTPGRLGAFASFNTSNVDASQVNNQNCVVQTNGIYVKCSAETEIKRLPFPCAIVHLAVPLTESKTTVQFAPLIDWINIVLEGNGEPIVKQMMKNNLGQFPIGIGTVSKPKIPTYLSIPLRSKLETYGGTAFGRGYWVSNGIPGNTEIEQDDSLNPWSYGGYIGMGIAATAKLFQVSVLNYAVEFGSMSFPGLPNHSLGDELYYKGSNITSIDVSVSEGGWVTNYRLRAFDPNIMGSLAKREEARFQRIGKTLAKLRLDSKEVYERVFANVGAMANTAIQNYNIHPALAPRTPHAVMVARNWNYDGKTAFHDVASLTPTEAIANIDVRDAESFKNFSMIGMNGLFRPFSTDPSIDYMPKYKDASTNIDSDDDKPTSYSFNPFRASNDMLLYSKGDEITDDIRALKFNPENNTLEYDNQGEYDKVRSIGIKIPTTFVGYGFDLYCRSVVTSGTSIGEDDRKKSQLWKAGPIDPIYDQTRGCWTWHDTLYGNMVANVAARTTGVWQSGGIRVLGKDNVDLNLTIPVWNVHNQSIASGKYVTVTYNAAANKFIIQSADC